MNAVSRNEFEVSYAPSEFVGGSELQKTLKKMGYPSRLSRPLGVISQTKTLTLQGSTDKTTFAPGSKGVLSVGLFLAKGKIVGGTGQAATQLSLSGPKELVLRKTERSVDKKLKGRQVFRFPIKLKKKTKPGEYQVTLKLNFQPAGEEAQVLTVRVPIVVKYRSKKEAF